MSPEFITPSADTLLSLKPRSGPLLTYMSLLWFTCLDEHTPSDAFTLSDSHTLTLTRWDRMLSSGLGQESELVINRTKTRICSQQENRMFFAHVCFVWLLVHASLLIEERFGILEDVLSCNFIMQSLRCTYNLSV